MARRISKHGIDFIRQAESEVLRGYLDSVGKLTVGVGHLVKPGEPYRLNKPITREESERLLIEDLEETETCVDSAVQVPLNDNEFAALVSLAFNIGCRAFEKSSVVRRLNAGNRVYAADAFLLWNKGTVKGKRVEIKGLTRRRKAERELFLSRVATDSPTASTPDLPTALPPEPTTLTSSADALPGVGGPANETADVSTFDKLTGKFNSESVKRIAGKAALKAVTAITGVWGLGLHGKILVVLAGLIITVVVVYEVHKYWPRVKVFIVRKLA